MEKPVFYDVHCHAMDLSHPSFYAFLRRFLPFAPFGPIWGLLASIGWVINGKKILNLLSVMERDVGKILMTMDDDIQPLSIGGVEFGSVTITPLMMDFWADVDEKGIRYQFAPKSIVPQVVDMFNGIADYAKSEFGPGNRKMAVFPFMGLNTRYCFLEGKEKQDHESTSLNILLKKHFGPKEDNGGDSYTGKQEDLLENFGKFNGNINDIGTNYYAGIKLYPPLGFDPWPESEHERDKVEYLYGFCQGKGIPVVSHCSDGGFVIGDHAAAVERSNPGRWVEVLAKYPDLKLDIAHFGGANAGVKYVTKNPLIKCFSKGNPVWVETIVKLLVDYPNVYTDISYSGVNRKYYQTLNKIIDKHPMVMDKILFGTDFSINLQNISSYKEYIQGFIDSELDNELKVKMCNKTPEKFLFKNGGAGR